MKDEDGSRTNRESGCGEAHCSQHTATEGAVKSLLSRMNGCFLLLDICD